MGLEMINEYSLALFELADQDKNLDSALESFNAFMEIYSNDNDFSKLLSSPNVSKENKKEIITKAFNGCYEQFILFINVIIDNARISMINDIYSDFKKVINEKNNIVTIDVISQSKLDDFEEASIIKSLEKKFNNKKVILNKSIDSNLIGGFKLFHNGKQIDASLKSQLDNLKNIL